MHSKEYWINWGKRAGIRALRTLSQSAIATIGISNAMGDIDWKYVLSTSALAGIISMLTSIRGLPEIKIEEELLGIKNTMPEKEVGEQEMSEQEVAEKETQT